MNGRDLLVLPQKSGMAYALDPDKEGEIVWQHRIGQGSGLGGQWGGAVDEQQAYFGVSDLLSPKPGGMRAVNLATGELAWSVEPQERLCDPKRPTCRASQGAAVTVIPGAVLLGLARRRHARLLHQGRHDPLDLRHQPGVPDVNGVKANGGGLEGPGADRLRRNALLQLRLRRIRRQRRQRAARVSASTDRALTRRRIVARASSFCCGASAASAQLLAAKDGPIVYGHHHIAASDIPAQLKFFADTLGGTKIKFGPQQVDVVKFPNVFIFFRNQKPTGGTQGDDGQPHRVLGAEPAPDAGSGEGRRLSDDHAVGGGAPRSR